MNGYTLGEWLDEWYGVYKAPRVKPETLRNIDIIIRLHVPAELKAKPLDELTAEELEKAVQAVQAPRMRQYTHMVLNDALQPRRDCRENGAQPHGKGGQRQAPSKAR